MAQSGPFVNYLIYLIYYLISLIYLEIVTTTKIDLIMNIYDYMFSQVFYSVCHVFTKTL